MSVIAALKKDVNKVEMKCLMRCGKPVTSEIRLPKWMEGWRRYTRYNSVCIFLDTNGVLLNNKEYESRLEIPRASLVEYNGKYLNIFRPGTRKMNAEERKAWNEWKAIEATLEYQRQLKTDLLSDGSTCYWRKAYFWQDKEMEYMRGFKTQRGMHLDINSDRDDPDIFDERVKGKLYMVYKVREVA